MPRKATSDQSSRPSATLSALRSRSSSIGSEGARPAAPRDSSARPPGVSSRPSRSRRRVRNSSPARGARRSIRPVPDRRTALPPGSSSSSTLLAFTVVPRASNLAESVSGRESPAGWTGGPTVSLAEPSASGTSPRRDSTDSGLNASRASASSRGSASPPPVSLRASAPSALIVPVARWNGLPATIPSASQGPASAGAFSRTSSAENISLGAAPSWTVATERRRTLSASITTSRRGPSPERGSSSASCATGRVTRARSITVPVKRTSPFSSGARAISASTVWASSAGPSSAPRISRSKRRCGEGRSRRSTAPSLRAGVPRDWVIARSISARWPDQSMKGGTVSAATRISTTAPASAVRRSRTEFAFASPCGVPPTCRRSHPLRGHSTGGAGIESQA